MRSDRLGETLLPKRLALPDLRQRRAVVGGLRPDEILLTLGLAGGAFAADALAGRSASPSSFVMLVVVASYRQNVHAYPSGGGDYEVATVNLGPKAGLTVASALLVDYVLTVAVSVSSGVQNAGAALAFVRGHEVPVAVGPRRAADRDEPARRPRVRQGLRRAGLRVHGRHHRHGRLRLHCGSHRHACPRPTSAQYRPRAGAGRRARLGRLRHALPAAAGVLLRLCGPDRRRGDQQRRARLQEAEEQQRRHDAAAHGRHRRSPC